MDIPLSLDERNGLPDALRVLLADYPRDLWQSDRNFHGLVSFWLERHLMFRQVLTHLRKEGEAFLDGRTDPQRHGARTAQLAGRLINELHGHHQIEDHQYFPKLAKLEPRLKKGFDLLDHDHIALDGHLQGLTENANALLRGLSARKPARDAAGRLQKNYSEFERFLDRHLIDEEDLIVPVLLRHAGRV